MMANEKNQEFVVEVSAKKLYKKAKADKVPFHQWYPWIAYQIAEIGRH
jgi:hypothetical protein